MPKLKVTEIEHAEYYYYFNSNLLVGTEKGLGT